MATSLEEFRRDRLIRLSSTRAGAVLRDRLPVAWSLGQADAARDDGLEHLFAEIPFGGGHHKCIGNAFAILQVKAILSTLLRRYDFELTQAPESYGETMPALILRPTDPCVLRYRRRAPELPTRARAGTISIATPSPAN